MENYQIASRAQIGVIIPSTVGQVKQLLDAATHHGVTARTQDSLQTRWPEIRASLLNRLERRKETRLQNMVCHGGGM